MSKSVPGALKRAEDYPMGIAFDVAFDAFDVRLTILPDDQISFVALPNGPFLRIQEPIRFISQGDFQRCAMSNATRRGPHGT